MIDYCISCLDRLKTEKTYRNVFRIFCSHGERPAVEFKLDGGIRKLTYADMEFVSEYAADRILSLMGAGEGGEPDGKKDNGFICFKLANCPEWFAIFWGILMAGYKPFLIDARHDAPITQYFIDQTNPAAIICDGELDVHGTRILQAGDILALGKRQMLEIAAGADRTSKTAEERIVSYSWADEVALCTSGTTSTAKIYVYNGNVLANQIECAREIIIKNEIVCSDRDKRNLAFLPLNHIFGFMANYIWYSFFATSQVVPDRIAPSVLLAACKDHKVTHILAVPLLINNIASGLTRKIAKEPGFKRFMFRLMLRISLFAQRISPEGGIRLARKMMNGAVLSQIAGPSIECIISGGGHVLPETLRIVNGIGYYTLCGFGMTEVGISSLELRKDLKARLSGCVGVPVTDVEYKIVPLDGKNEKVGELKMRGDSLHSAMIRDGQYIPRAVDEEGWFASGDIGRLTDGALYIEGRLKEVIINESGENVYPDELEDTFLDLSGVKAFTVLGIKKDATSPYEDIVLVCQVSNPGDAAYVETLRREMIERNGKLPVYKKVDYALLTADDLPVSNGIKIRRVVIKRQAENGEGNFVKVDQLKKAK